MQLKRLIFLIIGCVSLGLGCVGIVLPILPTVPFFLLTVFCFSQSSKKLHDWFVNTKMYHKHLESFVQKKGMTACTKATILTSDLSSWRARASGCPASFSPSSGRATSSISSSA